MTMLRAFLISLALALVGVLGYAAVQRDATSATASPGGQALLGDVFVRDQIALEAVGTLPANGYRTLVNLRPDGEQVGQPPSADVAAAAAKAGLQYAFIPTPKSEIPDATADALAATLAEAQRPVVLYCRSGNRAARVWALAEASRAGGPSAAEIAAAVKSAGQSVDDLLPRIEKRIAQRAAIADGKG